MTCIGIQSNGMEVHAGSKTPRTGRDCRPRFPKCAIQHSHAINVPVHGKRTVGRVQNGTYIGTLDPPEMSPCDLRTSFVIVPVPVDRNANKARLTNSIPLRTFVHCQAIQHGFDRSCWLVWLRYVPYDLHEVCGRTIASSNKSSFDIV